MKARHDPAPAAPEAECRINHTSDSKVWRYTMQHQHETVYLVAHQIAPSHLMVTFSGSFGNWCMEWWHTGHDDGRAFLRGVGGDYLLRKLRLGHKDGYDGSLTLEAVQEEILTLRRGTHITKERARELWNSLGEEHESLDNEWAFYKWMEDCPVEFEEAWEFAHYSPPGDLVALCEVYWPPLRAYIRREYDAEVGA